MEKILVALQEKDEAWEALSHACSLAGRIPAQLSVLLVQPRPDATVGQFIAKESKEFRKRLELLMEAAKAEGIAINFFIAEGEYVDEVISFIMANRISLFIHETRFHGKREKMPGAESREPAALSRLRHKIPCRMEVVVPRQVSSDEGDGQNGIRDSGRQQ